MHTDQLVVYHSVSKSARGAAERVLLRYVILYTAWRSSTSTRFYYGALVTVQTRPRLINIFNLNSVSRRCPHYRRSKQSWPHIKLFLPQGATDSSRPAYLCTIVNNDLDTETETVGCPTQSSSFGAAPFNFNLTAFGCFLTSQFITCIRCHHSKHTLAHC